MAISYIASASAGSNLGYNSGITVNKPTGTAENDLMIINVSGAADAASFTHEVTFATPSGWILIDNLDYNSGSPTYYILSTYVFYKVAGASEPSNYTISRNDDPGDPNSGTSAIISTFRGIDTGDPIGNFDSQTNNNTTNHTAPTIDVQKANNWVVHTVGIMNNVAVTPPSGTPTYTERVENQYDGPGGTYDDVVAQLSSAIYTSSGATGTKTATTAGNQYGHAFHIEIQQDPPKLTMKVMEASLFT